MYVYIYISALTDMISSAAVMAETQDVCFEDGFPWLPPHVLDHQPCFHCKVSFHLSLSNSMQSCNKHINI